MKKTLVILFVVLAVGAFAVPAVAAQGEGQGAVQAPGELEALIQLALIYLVTQGLKSLGDVFGVNLSGKAAAVAAGLSTAVIAFLNGWLALIPATWEPSAKLILQLVVALLGAGGFYRLFKRK